LPVLPAATHDVSVPGKPGADLDPDHDPPEARLTVAAVARRLGVAPATLRTWDRRYGLGPTLHSAGAHRRYSRSDIARLEAMRRLVLDGVPPADAARLAVETVSTPRDGHDSPPPGPSGRLGVLDPPAEPRGAGGPGGRVLALPGGTAEVRGLARAAMALDSRSLRIALDRALAEHGVITTWTELLTPVLIAVGERWAATGEGIEVEHLLAETATSALRAVGPGAPEPRNGRPVLLACAPDESHSLPLAALAAALAERNIGVRLLGGGLPATALVAAVRRTGPAVLLVWAQLPRYADVRVLDDLPVLRPPVAVLAGGSGWRGRRLPARVAFVSDLTSAVGLVTRAVGG
jgi:MerR family transcriptional regulator, light-induced transcriptional regulator